MYRKWLPHKIQRNKLSYYFQQTDENEVIIEVRYWYQYQTKTNFVNHSDLDIEIEVETRYLPEESDPGLDKYVFIYEIKIFNCGNQPLQLLGRHWIITDGNQQVLEVEGSGVVGQQPRIEVGEFYQYTSGTVLETPIGSMHGSYDMVTDDGNSFIADIPEFSLVAPGQLH